MAVSLARLPRFLVLEPVSTMRFEIALPARACEISVEAEDPRPDRTFLLMLGPPGGPLFHRMRLSGRGTVLFEPTDARMQVLLLSNPQREPLVLRLRARTVRRSGSASRAGRPRLRVGVGRAGSPSTPAETDGEPRRPGRRTRGKTSRRLRPKE